MKAICPVCLNFDGTYCIKEPRGGDSHTFNCERCGRFRISDTAYEDQYLRPDSNLSKYVRAALSHEVRTKLPEGDMIKSDWLESKLKTVKLPSPRKQEENLIRIIGLRKEFDGEPTPMTDGIAGQVGALEKTQLHDLRQDLERRNLIVNRGRIELPNRSGGVLVTSKYDLTHEGWTAYEKLQSDHLAGARGFVALKFENSEFNGMLKLLKPQLEQALGHPVVDMRDVSKAGIIDAIMREELKRCSYVIADLTDDNCNVYWEAGYADALGKPVIYVCEQGKFISAKQNFDTSHLTTVIWRADDVDSFRDELVKTIRRSLDSQLN